MELLSVVAEEFLSDATLRRLAGRDELEAVRYLEMTADTSEQTLGDLGRRLPALEELRLSSSNISTLRDLGTALHGLQVLWIARSSLVELEGFGAFANLRELFAAFNDVVDLSPISGAERLQVLDLEGNAVDDPSQVLYLQECAELSSLNLQDNPCAEAADYRAHVRAALPQLQLLDDEPIADSYAEDALAPTATATDTATATATATDTDTATATATATATSATSDSFISAYLSTATAAAAAGAPPPAGSRGRARTERGSPSYSGADTPPWARRHAASVPPVPSLARAAEAAAMAERGAAVAVVSAVEARVVVTAGEGRAATAMEAAMAAAAPPPPRGESRARSRREIALLRDAIKYTDSMRAFDVQSFEARSRPGFGFGRGFV